MKAPFSTLFHLAGMDCPACANTIEIYAKKIEGVSDCHVSYQSATIKLSCESKEILDSCIQNIEKLGYKIKPFANTSKRNENRISSHESLRILWKELCSQNKKKFWKPRHLNQNESQTFSHPTNHRSSSNLVFLGLGAYSISYLICFLIELQFPHAGVYFFDGLTAIFLWPIFKKVIQFFRVKYFFSMELLMSLGIFGALLLQCSKEAAMVLLLYRIGEALEAFASEKATQGLKKIISLIPSNVHLVQNDGIITTIPSTDVAVGQTLLVKTGERFPVDGVIFEGHTHIDESLISGESTPISKISGQQVTAGSLNLETPVKIKSTAVGNEHTAAKLIKLVEEAQETKPRSLKTIEKFTQYYTPFVLCIAILTAIIPPLFLGLSWSIWIYKSLAVLLIGCPCALIMSSPSAISAAIFHASQLGALFKNGISLETLGKVSHIAFDKTGTLTKGHVEMTELVLFNKAISADGLLSLAASLEKISTHPLAKSVVEYAEKRQIPLYRAKQTAATSGVGLEGLVYHNDKDVLVEIRSAHSWEKESLVVDHKINAEILRLTSQGKSVALIFIQGVIHGALGFQDSLRLDAKKTIEHLNEIGLECSLLTGDHKRSAEIIASQLNLKALSELLPKQKLEAIKSLQQNHIVAMVGDGLNDAPALATAHVGLAMAHGTDISLHQAQVIITNPSLLVIPDVIKLSRQATFIVKQNIFLAIFLKVLFLAYTYFGDASLWFAILADTGTTLGVILNSLRLLKVKKYF